MISISTSKVYCEISSIYYCCTECCWKCARIYWYIVAPALLRAASARTQPLSYGRRGSVRRACHLVFLTLTILVNVLV